MALANPHDRIMALRRVTAAAQVLLARTMVMRALSLLSVRFVELRFGWRPWDHAWRPSSYPDGARQALIGVVVRL